MNATRELLDVLRTHRRLLILTHANPDPDSLASAMGLRFLAERAVGLETVFAFAGRIMRAENREMVRRCEIEMVPQDQLDPDLFDCLAVVDTQPGFGHTKIPEGRPIDIVVDHHVPPASSGTESNAVGRFHDVRTDVGATSTLVGSYLLDAKLEVPPSLATALIYGLVTDTADLTRNVSPLDERVYEAFSPKVDRDALRHITRPALPPDYYRTLGMALSNVRIYGDLVLCSLGRIDSPEMVAEVADLLLRLEGKQTVLCGGLVGESYYVSLRTELVRDAYDLLELALDGQGSFGGHGQVAGGSVVLPDAEHRTLKRFERRLEKHMLEALGRDGVPVIGLQGSSVVSAAGSSSGD